MEAVGSVSPVVTAGVGLDPVAAVTEEVRELVRRSALDPAREPERVRRLVEEVVAEYDERTLTSGLPVLGDRRRLASRVWDEVAGYGPLQRHLDDPEIEEIWVNEPGRVFVARRGRSELTTTVLEPGQVQDLVERMLKSSGRRVDLSQPFVDAMLPDGSRLHVVIPDITRRHWAVNPDQRTSTLGRCRSEPLSTAASLRIARALVLA